MLISSLDNCCGLPGFRVPGEFSSCSVVASKKEQGVPESLACQEHPLLKAEPTCRKMFRGALIDFVNDFVESRGIEFLLH